MNKLIVIRINIMALYLSLCQTPNYNQLKYTITNSTMRITKAEAIRSTIEKLFLFSRACSIDVVCNVNPSSCANAGLGVAIETTMAIATLAKKKKEENFKKFISA